jgi:hypothetical protein
MFRRRTLFIVGAGASNEVSFPVGPELAKTIADNMRPGRERHHQATIKDEALLAEFRSRVGYDKGYQDFMDAARRIHEGIELTHSVDDFLNVHQKNPLVVEVGKASIIRAIIAAEASCALYVDQSNIYNRMNIRDVSLTWFVKLMRVLAPYTRPQSPSEAFNNVAFIVFNYDRCLEHFLEYAISALYGMERMKARDIVTKIQIIHPYGHIGELESLPFGGQKGRDYAVLSIADRIKTYAEQFKDEDQIRAIRQEMEIAECIVFLGYGFLEQNMALLKPETRIQYKPVFGAAKGLSDHSTRVVVEELYSMFDNAHDGYAIELNNMITCGELFDYYARSLNAPRT